MNSVDKGQYGLEQLTYKERPGHLGLFSLEKALIIMY